MTDLNIITVTEFGQYAPEVNTSNYVAATISGFIQTASKIASDYLGYTPLAEDITAEVKDGRITVEGDLLIFPAKPPVQRVDSISVVRGTVSVDLNLTSGGNNRYNIDYTKRNIRYPYQELSINAAPTFIDFASLRGTQFYTKVSYRGGWEASDIPNSIKQAVVLITKDLFSGQNNVLGATRISQGALSFGYGGQEAKSKAFMDAMKLLNPYRRIG